MKNKPKKRVATRQDITVRNLRALKKELKAFRNAMLSEIEELWRCLRERKDYDL